MALRCSWSHMRILALWCLYYVIKNHMILLVLLGFSFLLSAVFWYNNVFWVVKDWTCVWQKKNRSCELGVGMTQACLSFIILKLQYINVKQAEQLWLQYKISLLPWTCLEQGKSRRVWLWYLCSCCKTEFLRINLHVLFKKEKKKDINTKLKVNYCFLHYMKLCWSWEL